MYVKQDTSKKQAKSNERLLVGLLHGLIFNPKEGGSMFL
jgi:hypothetical protein